MRKIALSYFVLCSQGFWGEDYLPQPTTPFCNDAILEIYLIPGRCGKNIETGLIEGPVEV